MRIIGRNNNAQHVAVESSPQGGTILTVGQNTTLTDIKDALFGKGQMPGGEEHLAAYFLVSLGELPDAGQRIEIDDLEEVWEVASQATPEQRVVAKKLAGVKGDLSRLSEIRRMVKKAAPTKSAGPANALTPGRSTRMKVPTGANTKWKAAVEALGELARSDATLETGLGHVADAVLSRKLAQKSPDLFVKQLQKVAREVPGASWTQFRVLQVAPSAEGLVQTLAGILEQRGVEANTAEGLATAWQGSLAEITAPSRTVGHLVELMPEDPFALFDSSIRGLRYSSAAGEMVRSEVFAQALAHMPRDILEAEIAAALTFRFGAKGGTLVEDVTGWLDTRVRDDLAHELMTVTLAMYDASARNLEDVAKKPEQIERLRAILIHLREHGHTETLGDMCDALGLSDDEVPNLEELTHAISAQATQLRQAHTELNRRKEPQNLAMTLHHLSGAVAELRDRKDIASGSYMDGRLEAVRSEGKWDAIGMRGCQIGTTFVVNVLVAISTSGTSIPTQVALGAGVSAAWGLPGLGDAIASVDKARLEEAAGVANRDATENQEQERNVAEGAYLLSVVVPPVVGAGSSGLRAVGGVATSLAVDFGNAGLALWIHRTKPGDAEAVAESIRAVFSRRPLVPPNVRQGLLTEFFSPKNRQLPTLDSGDVASAFEIFVIQRLGE